MSIEAMKQMIKALEDTSASKHISRNSAIQAGLKAIAEAEKQEPVAQCMEHGECFGGKCIYTQPQPKREWVGLTDEERDYIVMYSLNVALSIEEKLKEKNT